jgi:prostatic aicd phosphatase
VLLAPSTQMADSKLAGVVVIARHGDRSGFFQDPTTYKASDTTITPLGTTQEFQLGGILRSLYLDDNAPLAIDGINGALVDTSQIKVRADAGDEGGVIFDSSIALLQALYPPSKAQAIKLSNGTTITSPMDGYQYVPSESLAFQKLQALIRAVESVEAAEDVSLEGHASCTVCSSFR